MPSEYFVISSNSNRGLPGGWVLSLMVVVWLSGVGYGVNQVWKYSTTPGIEAPHPARWPGESRIPRGSNHPTLVMFVHPRCPCSRASLAELDRITQLSGQAAETFIVFLRPDDTAAGWEQTDIWASAQRIANGHVVTDVAGTEAARFGAETSGQVLLYDAAGELKFAGGITGSRGHEGDNPGARRVFSLVNGTPADRDGASVYGCPLVQPAT